MTVEDTRWTELSRDVVRDITNFTKWEALVQETEALAIRPGSPEEDKQLLKTTYENLLVHFPLCEQYWVNFAERLFQLKLTFEARDVYERGLKVMPGSVYLWTHYVRFLKLVVPKMEAMLKQLHNARAVIGLHFYSHEFYDEYLRYLRDNELMKEYYALLRAILEVPLYHYSKYFEEYLELIDRADMMTIKYIVSAEDLKTHYNLTWPDLNRDAKKFSDLRSALRKRFTELYTTTQYRVYELWTFEKHLGKPFFRPMEQLTRLQLDTWSAYLDYFETSDSTDIDDRLTKTAYERCVIVTGLYPQFWLKYAAHYVSRNHINIAIAVLQRAVYHNPVANVELREKLIDLEVLSGQLERAQADALEWTRIMPNSVQAFVKLLSLEAVLFSPTKVQGAKVEPNEERDQYVAKLVRFKLKKVEGSEHERAFDFVFAELLEMPVSHKALEALFEEHSAKKSLVFWRSYHALYKHTDTAKATQIEARAANLLNSVDLRLFRQYAIDV